MDLAYRYPYPRLELDMVAVMPMQPHRIDFVGIAAVVDGVVRSLTRWM